MYSFIKSSKRSYNPRKNHYSAGLCICIILWPELSNLILTVAHWFSCIRAATVCPNFAGSCRQVHGVVTDWFGRYFRLQYMLISQAEVRTWLAAWVVTNIWAIFLIDLFWMFIQDYLFFIFNIIFKISSNLFVKII